MVGLVGLLGRGRGGREEAGQSGFCVGQENRTEGREKGRGGLEMRWMLGSYISLKGVEMGGG